jgi:hypothetical protein
MQVARQYSSITDIKDEVRALVTRGSVGPQNRIYELSKYFGDREWPTVESLLETYDYLLRDPIIDLVGKESWLND